MAGPRDRARGGRRTTARGPAAPSVRQDPHPAGRHPARPTGDLRGRRPSSARHGRLAVPPGRQHRPRARGRADRPTRPCPWRAPVAARLARRLDRGGHDTRGAAGLARRGAAPRDRRLGAAAERPTSSSSTTPSCSPTSRGRCGGSPPASTSTWTRRPGRRWSRRRRSPACARGRTSWCRTRLGVLKDPARFFRSGRSGAGSGVLSTDELARYERRVATLAPPDVVAWLHR